MVFILDVDALRDQLLNMLAAAQDTVSNIPPQLAVNFIRLMCSLDVVALDNRFSISRDVHLRLTSGCLEEGSRGGSRGARSGWCADGREYARVEIR